MNEPFTQADVNAPRCVFAVGETVEKWDGDYRFSGVVRAVFRKRSGQVRLVVEDDRGLLMIYSERNLRHVPDRGE